MAKAYGVFAQEFEVVRCRHGFVVAGYVLTPEHVHLLVGEPARSSFPVCLVAGESAILNAAQPRKAQSGPPDHLALESAYFGIGVQDYVYSVSS